MALLVDASCPDSAGVRIRVGVLLEPEEFLGCRFGSMRRASLVLHEEKEASSYSLSDML